MTENLSSVQEQNVLTEKQVESITAQIRTQALIGIKESPDVLDAVYQDNPLEFRAGIADLTTRYSMRRVRGDGNCFYRSFLFGYLEQLLSQQRQHEEALAAQESAPEGEGAWCLELQRVVARLRGSKLDLVAVGYQESAIDVFWGEIVEFVEALPTHTPESILEHFNEENGGAEYMVWYCRALSAGFLKADPERFMPFILGANYGDIASFCAAEVEPMYKECEQVQIIALSEYLGVGVRIEYLDGRSNGGASTHVFPDGVHPQLTLLYRPGHYDLLYPL